MWSSELIFETVAEGVQLIRKRRREMAKIKKENRFMEVGGEFRFINIVFPSDLHSSF